MARRVLEHLEHGSGTDDRQGWEGADTRPGLNGINERLEVKWQSTCAALDGLHDLCKSTARVERSSVRFVSVD